MNSVGHVVPAAFRLLCALTLWVTVSACSVFWVSSYSKEASERVADLTEDVLAMYQELLLVDATQRRSAVTGPIKTKHAAIETKMRVHLLQEQAREKNTESVEVARNMLEAWRRFGVSHTRKDATALSDDALSAERLIMERHLGAAMKAEEAKKFGRT